MLLRRLNFRNFRDDLALRIHILDDLAVLTIKEVREIFEGISMLLQDAPIICLLMLLIVDMGLVVRGSTCSIVSPGVHVNLMFMVSYYGDHCNHDAPGDSFDFRGRTYEVIVIRPDFIVLLIVGVTHVDRVLMVNH